MPPCSDGLVTWIYEAALDPTLYDEVVACLCDEVEASGAVLLASLGGEVVLRCAGGTQRVEPAVQIDVDGGGVELRLSLYGPAALGEREEALTAVARHLHRSVRLGAGLPAEAQEVRLLDAFDVALFVLEPDGRLSGTNARGESMLASAELLRVEEGLVCGPEGSRAAPRALVQQVLRAGTPQFCALPREGRVGAWAVGVPLDDGRVGLVVADPERPRTPPERALREWLGVTPAEARLVASLVRGATLREHADAAGISVHTARTQLRHVLAKTNTRRQSELVGLVLGGLPPVALSGE